MKKFFAALLAATSELIAQYWAKAAAVFFFMVMAFSGMTWWFMMATDIPEPQDHPVLATITSGAAALGIITMVIAFQKEEGGTFWGVFRKYFF